MYENTTEVFKKMDKIREKPMCNVVVRFQPKLIYFPIHYTLEYQGPTKAMKLLLRGKEKKPIPSTCCKCLLLCLQYFSF